MLKKLAIIFGVVMLLVGILGFIPGITTGPIDDGKLLGLFHVNILHDIIHLLTGIIGLYVGFTSNHASKVYFQVFGIVYLLVTILGFITGDGEILGLVANNGADNWLHVLITLVALVAGFGMKEDEVAAA